MASKIREYIDKNEKNYLTYLKKKTKLHPKNMKRFVGRFVLVKPKELSTLTVQYGHYDKTLLSVLDIQNLTDMI